MRRNVPLVNLVTGALCALLCAAGAGTASAETSPVSTAHPHSSLVSLERDGEHFCGGALVAPQYVVTAARCLDGHRPEGVTARVGSADRTLGGEVRRGVEQLTHFDFAGDTAGGGDVAVLRLDAPVSATPLPMAADETPVGAAGVLVGWGRTCSDSGDCATSTLAARHLGAVLDPRACDLSLDRGYERCFDSSEDVRGVCAGTGNPQLVAGPDGRWRLGGLVSRTGQRGSACSDAVVTTSAMSAHHAWVDEMIDHLDEYYQR